MSILVHKPIETVINSSLTEIDDRRKGLKKTGLKTRWNKLNNLIGGFQWGFNYLIAGLSGSGKSTLLNIIETDLFDYNQDNNDFIVLNFNFETDSTMNMIKKLSSDSLLTVNEILSSNSENTLNDESFNTIKQKSERYKNYPIFYFDVTGSVDDIEHTILAFHKTYNKKMFCLLDHTGLVTASNKENEIELVTRLSLTSVKLKKALNCSFLFLGQLNSNIEHTDRITNPSLHKPMRSDLFGGKAVWNAMDCIFIPHRPEMLSIDSYTNMELTTKNRMFFHVSKQRFGGVGLIIMDCSKIGLNIITEE